MWPPKKGNFFLGFVKTFVWGGCCERKIYRNKENLFFPRGKGDVYFGEICRIIFRVTAAETPMLERFFLLGEPRIIRFTRFGAAGRVVRLDLGGQKKIPKFFFRYGLAIKKN